MPFPVDKKFVTSTEEKLRMKFPSSYVSKMLKANGGEVETATDDWVLYPIFDTSDKKRLQRTCNDVVRETLKAREWRGFPPEAVAIGSNGCGDQLVLLPQPGMPDQLANEVYWWDHETGNSNLAAADFHELVEA